MQTICPDCSGRIIQIQHYKHSPQGMILCCARCQNCDKEWSMQEEITQYEND